MRSSAIPKEILALAAVAFCVALGFGVVTPAIPLFAQEFGVGATAAGAVVSAFALMRLVFGPFGGRLVDRLGERFALVAGLGLVALSSLLAGLSQNYSQLLGLRAVGGIGSTVFTVAATSLVIKVAAAHSRGRAMSTYHSGFLLGGIVGPAAGGAVLGISLRAPFFLYAATLGLACAVALIFLTGQRTREALERDEASPAPEGSAGPAAPEASAADDAAVKTPVADDAAVKVAKADSTAPVTGPATAVPPDHGGAASMRVRDALRMPAYRVGLAANLAVGFALFGMRSALVPLLVVDQVRADVSWVGWAFFVTGVAQAALMFPAGKLVDTIGRRTPLLIGALVTAAGLVLLGVSASVPVLIGAMVVLGVGGAFLGPVPGALLGDVVRGRGGTVVAVSQMVGDVGAVLGPLAAGVLVERASFGVAFGLGAAVVAVTGVYGLALSGRPVQPEVPGPDRTPADPKPST